MHSKISLTDYNLTKRNHRDQTILYQEHMLSTFCYSYPYASQFPWSHTPTLTQSTDSIVNIAGILHNRFHLYRSGLDPPDMFPVTTPYRSTNTAASRTCENSETPYFRNTAINMIMMIPYCTDKNTETAAVYFAHALFNSAKGFTASTNPFSASLNRLFREYNSPPCSNSFGYFSFSLFHYGRSFYSCYLTIYLHPTLHSSDC